MTKLRKFTFPTITVFFENIIIGMLENEQELLMFLSDMVGNPDHDKFTLITPKHGRIKVDKYGCYPYTEELESVPKLYQEIIEKQMTLRLAERNNTSD